MSAVRKTKIGMLILSWSIVLAVILVLVAPFYHRLATLIFPFSVTFGYWLKQPDSMVSFQYSHGGRVPRDYVAIFGDSYAFGQGDGLNTLQKEYRPAYNVTHFVYQHSKQDMVSFGVPTSGSLAAYLWEPSSQLAYLSQSWVTRIEAPSYIVLYFYEGNDIEENLVEMLGDKPFRPASISQSLWRPVSLLRLLDYGKHALLFVAGQDEWSGALQSIPNEPAPVGLVNRIVQGGVEKQVPDGFQGPSMLLSDDETEAGFAVMDTALENLRQRYPETPIVMLAIPSPATVYRFVSADIDLWDLSGKAASRLRPVTSIRSRSNDFCERAMTNAHRHGIYFHDARPLLVSHGEQEMLHGPIDMHHLNLAGYRVLSVDVAIAIDAIKSGDVTALKSCVVLQ